MSSLVPEDTQEATKTAHGRRPLLDRLLAWKRWYSRSNQVILDGMVIGISLVLAFWIRFEGDLPPSEKERILLVLPYVILIRLAVNYFAGVYSLVWRYVSVGDIPVILMPISLCSVFWLGLRIFLTAPYKEWKLPFSVIAIEFMLVLLGTMGIRILRRALAERAKAAEVKGLKSEKKVLLVGAGDGGVMVAREVGRRRDTGLRIVGFVDDDPAKVNSVIGGKKVLGTTMQLGALVHQHGVEEVVIAIAAAPRKDIRRIVTICESIPVKVKIIPGLYEILGGRVKVLKFRDVSIEDLLGRDVVQFDNGSPEVHRCYGGKRVLVTGAGGSIGSELCRQILAFGPKELILVEKDENSLFEIDVELGREAQCTIVPLIADIRDRARLETIFQAHHPEVIFHAAAHKHVPLMERNPSEAILNNVVGTKNLVELADRYGVETFVMLSTDKAVRPANVMGASKRLAEMIVQVRSEGSRTRFSCVRFGNVLGSRGSVVPIFQKQIARGGPVTVTDAEVTRYFMTIPEAAHLVIQAGSLAQSGEIFVLDMGDPVKICELAKDLIHLSGYKVGDDIDIEFVGLRPGEKLHEDLLLDKETAVATKFAKIFIESPSAIDGQTLAGFLQELEKAAVLDDKDQIRASLYSWFNGSIKQAGVRDGEEKTAGAEAWKAQTVV